MNFGPFITVQGLLSLCMLSVALVLLLFCYYSKILVSLYLNILHMSLVLYFEFAGDTLKRPKRNYLFSCKVLYIYIYCDYKYKLDLFLGPYHKLCLEFFWGGYFSPLFVGFSFKIFTRGHIFGVFFLEDVFIDSQREIWIRDRNIQRLLLLCTLTGIEPAT